MTLTLKTETLISRRESCGKTLENAPELKKEEPSFKSSVTRPAFFTWWQGGDRYAQNVSPDGEDLALPFKEGALYGEDIWRQLYPGIKIKPFNFNKIFGNRKPVNLEIGIGNGEFITRYAKDRPAENWLGAEVFGKVFEKAKKRILRAQAENIRIIQFDAALILRLAPHGSLNNIYVNFPDPWPKKSHKRRRLLKTSFLELASEKLSPGGFLHIVTDHEDYAAEISSNIASVKEIKSAFGEPWKRNEENYFPTKYYRKFASKYGAYFFRYVKYGALKEPL